MSQLGTFENEAKAYWEEAEQVERFAALDTDEGLKSWIGEQPDGSRLTVLDLGCAGGRNTEWLFSRGMDVYALDRSMAMVEATRRRVRTFAGFGDLKKRIFQGDICNMSMFNANTFDRVLAIGVIQSAVPFAKWKKALSEIYRILKPEGELLMSNFSPSSQPHGKPLKAISGYPHCYTGFGAGALCLMSAQEIDDIMLQAGFEAINPSESVRVTVEEGFRISVKGRFRKAGA